MEILITFWRIHSISWWLMLTAVGIRCPDHVTPLYPQKLALTSPTGGGRSVGVVRSLTKVTDGWWWPVKRSEHVVAINHIDTLLCRLLFTHQKLKQVNNSWTKYIHTDRNQRHITQNRCKVPVQGNQHIKLIEICGIQCRKAQKSTSCPQWGKIPLLLARGWQENVLVIF